MPITCPISIQNLSTAEFGKLDYVVMSHAFASHQCLGRLAHEAIYQADFAQRLVDTGFEVHREVPVTVSFETFSKTYYLDLVVADAGEYEIKSVATLNEQHEAQLLNYLLLLDIGHGKPINFHSKSVDTRYVNAPATRSFRQSFDMDDSQWNDSSTLKEISTRLVCDWGTGLELPLYYQAIITLLGGEDVVIKLLPMKRDDLALGNQVFYMNDETSAFRMTAFTDHNNDYETNLRKLLRHSPIQAIQWINIALQKITFKTIH